jgi:enoyl-[acyl-carrier-protein] reductase (NADH)
VLKRTATLAEVGNAPAFVASDLAPTMTAADVNISRGAIVDKPVAVRSAPSLVQVPCA